MDWKLRVQGSDKTSGINTVMNRGVLYWAAARNLTTFEGIKGRICLNGTAFDLHSQAIGFDSQLLFSRGPPRKLWDHASN